MALDNRGRDVPRDIAARGTPDAEGRMRMQRSGDPLPRVLTLRDPYDAPIPTAQSFVLNCGAIATAAVETLQPVALRLPLSSGEVARIDSVTIYITSLLDTTDVKFKLLAGGRPLLEPLSFFPRAATAAGDNYGVYLRVGTGQSISMDIQNVDGGSYTVGAIITGWKFAQLAGERFNVYGDG